MPRATSPLMKRSTERAVILATATFVTGVAAILMVWVALDPRLK